MIFTDTEIKKAIKNGLFQISPEIDDDCIQPASIDLKLSDEIIVQLPNIFKERYDEVHIDDRGYLIKPGEFILGSTKEYIALKEVAARIEGKSTLGRKGLMIHATAGFIDPGFEGNITLEMYNLSNVPIKLTADMKISQICLIPLFGDVERLYGHRDLKSHYQNQIGPTKPFTDLS